MYYYYNVISYIIPGAVIYYQDALLVFCANIFFCRTSRVQFFFKTLFKIIEGRKETLESIYKVNIKYSAAGLWEQIFWWF